MLFRDLSEDIIKKSIAKEKMEVKFQYERVNEKLLDFYEDRQLRDEYTKEYGFKKQDGKTDLPMVSYNLTKKIINKISLVYKNPPERKLEKSEAYTEWLANNEMFDEAIKSAERYKNLLGKVLFRPHYKQQTDEWVFFVETYYEAHFLEGDPLNPVAYSYPKRQDNDPNNVEKDWWAFWSNEYYFDYIPGTNRIRYDENFPDGKNPFDIIPFVELRDMFPVNQYDTSGAISLIQANENINIAMNDLNLMVHYQAFDQPIAKGITPTDVGKINAGPNKIIALTDIESDFSLLGYSPKITESIEAIKFAIQTVAYTYNLSINWAIESNPASGFSLLVQNIDLLEAREDDVSMAKFGEKRVYKVISAMNNYYKLKPQLPDEALYVNFADIDFPVNQKEELDQRNWYIEHNIKTPLDYMDADLSEDEKLEQFKKNKEINGKLTARDRLAMTVEEVGGEIA